MRAKGPIKSTCQPREVVLTALMLATLTGCGGGGGSGSAGGLPGATPSTPPVSASNHAPTIGGTPPTSATEGNSYTFQPSASDTDGDPLTFSAAGLPAWLAINGSTGHLSGAVPAGAAGTYGGIVISVTDGKATASLPSFSITVTAPVAGPAPAVGVAELQWTAPTKNEDGSALTNLAGYKVRYGMSPGALIQTLAVASPAQTSVTITGLAAGTWYFTLASYTNSGVESAPTGTVSKTIS